MFLIFCSHIVVAVFERALAVNDPKTVHFHLIDIFERSNNLAVLFSFATVSVRCI